MGLIKIYDFPLRHPQQVMAFMNLHEYLNLATKRNNPRLTHYYNPHMLHTIWSQFEPHFFMMWEAGPFGHFFGFQASYRQDPNQSWKKPDKAKSSDSGKVSTLDSYANKIWTTGSENYRTFEIQAVPLMGLSCIGFSNETVYQKSCIIQNA